MCAANDIPVPPDAQPAATSAGHEPGDTGPDHERERLVKAIEPLLGYLTVVAQPRRR